MASKLTPLQQAQIAKAKGKALTPGQNQLLRRKEARKESVKPPAARPVTCPSCASTQVTAQKRGWRLGRTVGMAATGLFLLPGGVLWGLAGGLGRKQIKVTCVNCGHSWIAGQVK